MYTKAIFHCGGGSNLILGIGRENKVFFLRTPATVNLFHQIVRKMILWCKKKNHDLPKWICITHIWSPTLFPRGILIFQGVLIKFNFLTKFQHLKKYYINLMKDPKYEHQSTFALWGEGQT